jgi:hypothetical protein
VAGWQRYYLIEEISAVRMVLKSASECDFGSGWVAPKLDLNFWFLWWKILDVMAATPRARGAVAVAGVAVVLFDRGDQCGSNGAKISG